MTLPSTPRRAGPFSGNDSATTFPFEFKVFAEENIRVVTASGGVETSRVLDSDYSVVLNGDQDADPGGTVTYPISGDPLATGDSLTIAGALAYDQLTDIPDGGNFNPTAIENTFDRIEMQIQQLAETSARTVSLALSTNTTSVSADLPTPSPGRTLAWNDSATALVNVDIPLSSASVAAGNVVYTPASGSVSNVGAALDRMNTIWLQDIPGADPTGVGLSTTAFLTAVAAANAAGITRVCTGPGTFRVAANVELGRMLYNNTAGAVTIEGDSVLTTTIMSEVTGTTALFSITGGDSNYFAFGGLKNLTIDHATFKSGQGCALKIESTIGNKLDNVVIRNLRYGVWLYNGVQFGGAGWTEFNVFDHVIIDYCDNAWRLEHNVANTNAVPSHGYNEWRHCLGNVYAVGGSVSPQIFFHIVNDAVNFYNSKFEFYVNTQDGGILIQANGNGGGPLSAGQRVGLNPSNSGSFHVEAGSACYVTGNRTFWWTGLLSYTLANFFDEAGISVDYPGYSVIRCDNYEFSGEDMNSAPSIDRFTDAQLDPKYPLARTGQNAPFIAVDDGNRRGLLVYSEDTTDGIFAIGYRGATSKLQEIVTRWWSKTSGKEQGNVHGFRVLSDTCALTTTATAFANFAMTTGAFTVYVKSATSGFPAYIFNISKASSTSTADVTTASDAPSDPGAHTIALTWASGEAPKLAVSDAAVAGNYAVSFVGVTP